MNTAGPNIDLHNNNSKIALLQSQKGFFLLKESFPFPLCHHMLALESKCTLRHLRPKSLSFIKTTYFL